MRPTKKIKSILSVGEVASVLQVAPKTVQQLIDRGVLHGYTIPTGSKNPTRRVHISALIEFCEKNKIPLQLLTSILRPFLCVVSYRGRELLSSLEGYLNKDIGVLYTTNLSELLPALITYRPFALLFDGVPVGEITQIAEGVRKVIDYSGVMVIGVLSEDSEFDERVRAMSAVYRYPLQVGDIEQIAYIINHRFTTGLGRG